MEQVTVNGTELAALTSQVQALTAKIDALAEQNALLAARAHAQAVRQQEWDEFKEDFTPVANDLYLVVVKELAELEPHVRLEDLLHLVKRLARNTRNFEQMLDQMESLQDFLVDFTPLTDQVVHSLVVQLDEMERKGYFGFAREGAAIADRVVDSFTEDDVRQLGENVVLILNTVKAMTQPEIMNMVNNVTVTYREVERDPELRTGMLDLVRQMRDPEVRRGLALTMRMLRAVAHQDGGADSADGTLA